ncbi:MAG: DNA translocase FtsK [Verrucomicrobiales bacterium]|nr:DNA translocase FtsK [Verrucomicrobiales bacterium]
MSTTILSVSEIRKTVYKATRKDNTGSGQRSNAMLGTWFHECFSRLIGDDEYCGWETVYDDVGGDGEELTKNFTERVYHKIIAPRLQDLTNDSNRPENVEILRFWDATVELNSWLGSIVANVKEEEKTFHSITEEDLSWRVCEPGWNSEVIVNGRADGVFRNPENGKWCVVELKLGKQAPEADLLQACLYYQMLKESQPDDAPGSLVLAGFHPELKVTILKDDEIEPVLSKLKNLIGEISGASGKAGKNSGSKTTEKEREPEASENLPKLGDRILAVLSEYGADCTIEGTPIVGPSFVRFYLSPGNGVRPKKVMGLDQEVQVGMTLKAPPFIHICEGKLVVDIQRPNRDIVYFNSCEGKFPITESTVGSSLVPIGIDLEGTLEFADLSKGENSHILVAGTTGSGKSEWLRAAIGGMVKVNTPATLRFILIDPKRNAFTEMKDSPFLLDSESLVFPGDHDVPAVLEKLIEEMEDRYRQMETCSADDLASLVKKTGKSIPRIVCVCDEYGDLVSGTPSEKREIESRIQRLGAKARAAGIHLILATQSPTREIISGTIKQNMTCKVGLLMSESIESNMIINTPDCKNLLGNGDLLFKDIGEPRRYQGLYMTAEDRNRIFTH